MPKPEDGKLCPNCKKLPADGEYAIVSRQGVELSVPELLCARCAQDMRGEITAQQKVKKIR